MAQALPNLFECPGVQYLDARESAIIHTLAYFSLFHHPLRKDELAKYLQFYPIAAEAISEPLNRLRERALVGASFDGFYYLPRQESLVRIRRERTARAQLWQRKVRTSVRVLANVLFVEAVGLSGSLSKGTQPEVGGDIDFMVICRPGRLWITQFLLRAFIGLLPEVHKKRFCANFLLASDHLFIPRRDLFTATEIVFLGPLMNDTLWQDFFRENAWIRHFYPNWTPPAGIVSQAPRLRLKQVLEWALAGTLGGWFEEASFNWFAHRRIKKQDPRGVEQKRWTDAGFSPERGARLQRLWEVVLDDFQQQNRVRLVRWQWGQGQAPRSGVLGSLTSDERLESWYRPDGYAPRVPTGPPASAE